MKSATKILTVLSRDKWNSRAMIVFEISVIVSLFMPTDSIGDWATFGICLGMLTVVVLWSIYVIWRIRCNKWAVNEPLWAVHFRGRIQNYLFVLFVICLLVLAILKFFV